MSARRLRHCALALLALLVYAQAGIAIAGCTMDRAEMARTAAHACCEPQVAQPGPLLDNLCVAHCTADLQRYEAPAAIVRAPSPSPVLVLPASAAGPPGPQARAAPQSGAVPARILFQSFLV